MHFLASEGLVTLVTSAKLPFNCAQPFPSHLGGELVVGVEGWVRERVCFPLGFQFLHQSSNLLFHP